MKLSRTESGILIGILYFLLFVLAGVWLFSFDNWQLTNQLQWVLPLFLDVNFFLIILGIGINRKAFKDVFQQINPRIWIFLLIISLGGTLLAMFAAPREHRIYYDEDIYMNVGQNIACLHKAGMCNDGEHRYGEYFCNRLEYNKDPNGWPYLLSLLMRLGGTSHVPCFVLNNIIFGISIAVVFLIGFLLFGDPWAGVFSALVFALIPEAIRWSNTTAAEPATALFSGLAILFVVWFAKRPGAPMLFLSAVTLPMAFQFRPESVLVVLPAGLALLLLAPKVILEKRIWLALLPALVLSLPHFVHLAAVKGGSWGAPSGIKFSIAYLESNFRVNSLFYFENTGFPMIFALLFLIGLVVPGMAIYTEKTSSRGTFYFALREKSILVVWFLAFWGIFLFFYAGSYRFGADIRFSLLSFMPIALLAGFACFSMSQWAHPLFRFKHARFSLAAALIFSFAWFVPYVKAVGQEAWGARADHHFAQIMAESLPPDSIVLTHNPSMFLLWGISAAQASIALNDPGFAGQIFKRYTGGVYFHYSFWCNVDDPAQKEFCEKMLEAFETEEVLSFSEQNYEYRLIKLTSREKKAR
jgi:hypothetical protein